MDRRKIISITIKEGETERPFGSGYTTKINGKETKFELKIVFNNNKKINSDVFIDIFSNTNSPLAKPTLSGSALHRFKMKMVKIQSIITYHIYYDGRIEKHIPKEIAEEFKQKYKYVYHDEKGNAAEILDSKGRLLNGIHRENWHVHIEACSNGDKVTTFMGKQRLQPEDYMKTKFDENGNAIK